MTRPKVGFSLGVAHLVSYAFFLFCSVLFCLPELNILLGYSDKKFANVNSEIFARVLSLQNFAYAKFCENKIIAKC